MPIELLAHIIPIKSLFYFCKISRLYYNARNAFTSKLLLQLYGISFPGEEIYRMKKKNINPWQCLFILKRKSNLHTLGKIFPSNLFPFICSSLFPIFGILCKHLPLTSKYNPLTNANLFFYKGNKKSYPIISYLQLYPELTFCMNDRFRCEIYDLLPIQFHNIPLTFKTLSNLEKTYLYRFFVSYAIDCLLEKRNGDIILLIKHNFPIFRDSCEYTGLPRSDFSVKALRRFLNDPLLVDYYTDLYFNPDSKAPLESKYNGTNFWNICKKRGNGTYAKNKMAELYPGIF